jgi:glycosyltransferase involved in cell wall biosynthesis
MRIGVSARWLDLPASGAREYTLSLIQSLLEKDHRNEYVIFHRHPARMGSFAAAREILLPGRSKLVWDYLSLPRAIARERVELFWTPSYIVPFPIHCKSVATVHDLAYLTMPRSYDPFDVLYMRLAMPGSFRRASALLSVSEHTRRDLVRFFPFTEGKVVVTHHGVAPGYREKHSAEMENEVRTRYSIQYRYIFYAGSLSPRKGVPYLLQAFGMLKRDQHIPHRLVLTGGWSWGNVDVRQLIETLGLQDDVIILGEVPADHMPILYRLADLFAYPSLYEGFGLPILEAMASQCPVVCSNLTSLPEVAGDAAILVDPRDVASLADAMYRALMEPATRECLKQRGVRRSECFTWEATADKTLQVFEKVGRA